MSRGPGKLQVKIMETLKQYHDLGESLEWRFDPGGSFRAKLANSEDIEMYEKGQRVELWKIRRDLGVSKPAISRALKGLESKGYVFLFDVSFEEIGSSGSLYWSYAKYAKLTQDGRKWLSVNK